MNFKDDQQRSAAVHWNSVEQPSRLRQSSIRDNLLINRESAVAVSTIFKMIRTCDSLSRVSVTVNKNLQELFNENSNSTLFIHSTAAGREVKVTLTSPRTKL